MADMDIESKQSPSRYIESDASGASAPAAPVQTILIVDPDASSRDLLARVLRGAGFECREAGDAFTATLALSGWPPAAVVLDRALPGRSGLEFLAMLKGDRRTRDIPIIMTSASRAEQDCVSSLEHGADDFIAKPFSALECIARLQAVLRRCARQASSNGRDAPDSDENAVIEYGGLRLDPLTHRVSAGRDKYIRLGFTEFRLLRFFLRHPERVHTRDELLAEIRGPNPGIDSRTVDTYVRRVRVALKPHGRHVFLRTVHGMGYQFSASGTNDPVRALQATEG